MAVIVGIAGAARNAAAALCDAGRILAVCEQERITRTRRAALKSGRLPDDVVETVLRLGGRQRAEVTAYAVAEEVIDLGSGVPVARVDHHRAHAATAFLTSPFSDAIVLVCDRHGQPELTVWRGDASGVSPLAFPWNGPGLASVYASAAHAVGLASEGDEHRLEALAHVAKRHVEIPESLVSYRDAQLVVSPQFQASLGSLGSMAHADVASVAGGVQRLLGELLLQVVADVRRRFGGRHLCLGGGLFFNSYVTTLLATSSGFEQTFVPVNPGNAGVAVGAALEASGPQGRTHRSVPLSPFLGPGFAPGEIKATLDNCKLSYDYVHDGLLIDRTVQALAQGKFAGWFQGRMEWGPRALGNRSILASPLAPFVLENLNAFLKQREPHRSYSVAVCAEDAPRYFRGPASSEFMEYEYDVTDREVFHALLPQGASRLRVQTVPESAGAFHAIIKAFGGLTGVPVLVNTSFNGFNEPIVCTPRDAVRVYYGTGLDMAAIGNFVLQK